MEEMAILYTKRLILFHFLILSIFGSCKEKREHHFGFDNNAFLLIKDYIDSNYWHLRMDKISNDSLVGIIDKLYIKEEGSKINDTILLQTYLVQKENEIVLRPDNDMTLWRNSSTPKILTLDENKSINNFVTHFNINLTDNFRNNNVLIKNINLQIKIYFFYHRIMNITITSNADLDKDILNEFYRIVYTSPKWILKYDIATQDEISSNRYVRDKNLIINLEIKNTKITKFLYSCDSLNIEGDISN
jgi:hypothetical protein